MKRFLIAAILALMPMAANAEGVSSGGAMLGPLTAPAGSWSGIGIGVYGAYVNADVDIPGTPITMGSTGYTAGGQLSADMQLGSIVIGAFGEYGWAFGDISDIGVDTEYAVGGKAGILINPQTLIYGLGALSWVEAEGETFEGWAFGGGVAVKAPSAPVFLSLEYRRATYDVYGVDVDADSVRVGMTYKLGGK